MHCEEHITHVVPLIVPSPRYEEIWAPSIQSIDSVNGFFDGWCVWHFQHFYSFAKAMLAGEHLRLLSHHHWLHLWTGCLGPSWTLGVCTLQFEIFKILRFIESFIAFQLKSLISLWFIMSKPQTRYWPIWRFDIGAESRLNLKEQRIPRRSRIETKSSNPTSAIFCMCFLSVFWCKTCADLDTFQGDLLTCFSFYEGHLGQVLTALRANENASACHLPSRGGRHGLSTASRFV